MSLWERDPEAFRQRYYEGEPYISTPYTEFGTKVGEALETGDFFDPTLKQVPRYKEMEHKLEVEVEGVSFLMYLDSFDPEGLGILEYKTGIKSKDGKNPWDRVKVRKHTQLPIYALGVYTKYGDYNPDVQLVWMETRWTHIEKEQAFGEKVFVVQEPGLELTGHVQVFDRHIEEWELKRMGELIRKNAEAISNDFKRWKINHKR